MNENKNSNDNSESDKSDIEEYKKMKEGDTVKKDKNLGKLLKTIVKKTKKIKGDYILSKNKLPLEKIKKEELELEKRKEKKILRNIKIRLGYVKYDEWDKNYEKKLLKATRRGVVKFFNSIVEHRKKEMEIQKNEEDEIKKKSNNFLMMHNLNYLNPNNEEDEDEQNKGKFKDENKNKKLKKKKEENIEIVEDNENEEKEKEEKNEENEEKNEIEIEEEENDK